MSACLDEGRVRGGAHQHALLVHAYRVFESAAVSPTRDLTWAWPILGLDDPSTSRQPGFVPMENAALAAFHRDRLALATAQITVAKSKAPGGVPGGSGNAERGLEQPDVPVLSRRAKAAAAAAARKRAEEIAKAKGQSTPKK